MKKDKEGCDGNTCMLCRWAVKEWKPAIALQHKNYLLKKGELLFRENEPVNGIFFVYDGLVKVHKHWGDDKELIIRFARKGDIVGHRGMGTREAIYPVSATAMAPTQVCFVDMEFFTSSLKVNQGLLYELLLFFADELQTAEKQMRNLVHMPVKARLANAFLLLESQFGYNKEGFIDIELNKQDLASYIGATFETTFRVLNELIEARLIAIAGKYYTILNVPKLTQLAHT
ncbi:cAMP-binding domain of CRP or a regulatory subunit of cAMP-dependent protein kinases [Chitinophaga terrae (ex Kim and Jung 2007)]|uniref:cAMP-binding domain of CRP or a regulatory subunit of cAMP-dependent protein kinases n=1 Tax=Chitinophaga terrae (ex Kim and Jung 2007) TaxID=408074 RepID=A0A1H3XAY4_9BACT|nr:Crp/Fnr family transcriptional regulator [Chitinophaga terrae (ex Kim and Jung 2007)]MDQ0108913.1 CRP/FNR family transcriptional regulator [Chitinophaga terrae (ex Kim and Jung 2007)]GEP89821.1 Crp/Fnr family transcriptional regulator [Chitinophaga terrae (ex Kim and Jung 2007)]SDZ96556.1 cAMP-binding domain of CRP or a regulatory subunit of cAMP-dependent protein kinases [Chitinophaga terrae (ex Kim and Jung 2007)]